MCLWLMLWVLEIPAGLVNELPDALKRLWLDTPLWKVLVATALTVLGGVGLFLLGMKIMTEALREVAGAKLRWLLARFTTSPLRGVASGMVATAVIQSSSATTVMTVGFVGAGFLSFPQALYSVQILPVYTTLPRECGLP